MKGREKRLGAMLLVAALITVACPKKEELPPGPETGPVQERLSRLEVLYEILLKDHPPTADTFEFRQWLSQAQKALAAGRSAEAERLSQQAEEWILSARTRYYNEHEVSIMAGRSPETAVELMTSAHAFVRTAQDCQQKGNSWAAEQYFQAAIEQCELALLAAQRSPEQALQLVELAREIEAVYQAAGRPDKAAAVRERVIAALTTIISDLDKSLRSCLRERSPECSRQTLSQDKEKYKEVVAEMEKKNELRSRLVAAALQYAPDRFHVYDYGPHIAQFRRWWENYWNPAYVPPEITEPAPPPVERDRRAEEIAAHDRLKEGAQPAAAAGVNLVETDVVTRGGEVAIRGMLTNMRTEPIYRPRITVVGGSLMAAVVDLNFPRMDPMISTSFELILRGYSADAYFMAGNKLPYHELLLIFQDSKGREIKVLQPVP